MFGLDVLGLSTMLILASTEVNAINACVQKQPRPVVQVSFQEEPVYFDVNKSVAELSQFDLDTVSPYEHPMMHNHVGGVMSGEITVQHRLRLRKIIDEKSGFGCVWFDRVEIKLNIKPTIYIASDFNNDECWFREIFEHESKHVEVDREIMVKYTGQFTDGLNMVLVDPAEYMSGVIPASEIEKQSQEMHTMLEHSLAVLFDKLQLDRNEQQAKIDSKEEYDRVSRACGKSS